MAISCIKMRGEVDEGPLVVHGRERERKREVSYGGPTPGRGRFGLMSNQGCSEIRVGTSGLSTRLVHNWQGRMNRPGTARSLALAK